MAGALLLDMSLPASDGAVVATISAKRDGKNRAAEKTSVSRLWAHIKRSLANLATCTLSELETLLRRGLEALQYRHGVLDGFLAGTGLALDRPDGP
jgi:hypothetical protein